RRIAVDDSVHGFRVLVCDAPRNDSAKTWVMIRSTSRRRRDMPDLLEAIENGVAWLTLNRPERLNALSTEMTGALTEALNRIATDREVGCVVITGAGRGWCAGGDVKSMEARGRDLTVEDRVEGLRRAHKLPLLMRNCPKPIIGMINGPVAGAGLGLA